MELTSFKKTCGVTLTLALALELTSGCVRRKVESGKETAARPHPAGISVTTHGRGPVTYEVTSTNTPEGVKKFKFVPSR